VLVVHLSTTSVNHLRFNVSKCKSMLISRKRNPLQCPVLVTLWSSTLTGGMLQIFRRATHLWSDSWFKHTKSICAKAKKLLGMIYRCFSEYSNPDTLLHMYESMVRPHLEYASQVWDPHLQKDREGGAVAKPLQWCLFPGNWLPHTDIPYHWILHWRAVSMHGH